MKKSVTNAAHVIICVLLIASLSTACSTRAPEAAQEGSKYSNLASQAVQDKFAEIMTSVDIPATRQQVFFDHVNQFNTIVDAESLVAEFEPLTTGESKYDPYEMQAQWDEKSPDFMGYNCRITAFGLFRDFMEIAPDSETRDEMIMMDLAALEEDASVLLADSDKSAFATLYSTIPTTLTKDTDIHVQNLQKDWQERGIKFLENDKVSLISVVFHESLDENDNYLFIGHTGVLFAAGDKLYFIEKIAFQEPYQLTTFANRTQLNEYLMTKYDTAFNQPTAAPFILENDQLLDD